NELYVALLSHKHDSYWDDDEQYGAIAVLDKNNLHLIDKLDIQVDPFDIIAGRDGYLYVPSGSGQWANFDSYNRSTKQRVGRVTIRQQSYARLHPNLERIYTIDTENRGYKAYNISKGNFLEPAHPGGYDSPYQGDYSLDTYFSLDPTGKYLFNGGGVIFNTTTDKENDMTYANKGIDPFTGIAFDQDGSRYYTLPKDTNSVNIYDAVSFQKIGDFNINGIGKYIFKSGSNLVILSETTDTSNKYKIQVIDLTKLVHSISLSVSPDQPQAVGTPITLSAEATGGVIPEYYFSVKEGGGHWEIIQAWSSANTCTWTPKMGGTAEIMVEARSSEAIGTRVYAYREYVVIPEAAIPGVWKIPAEITDTIIDPVNPVIYMISKTDKKLYSVNYITGDSMVTGFQYMPECLEFGQGEYSNELYVAFPTQEHDMYWSADDQTGKIAVINKDNLDLIDTIDISIDPFDLVSGRDGYLYVTSGSGQSSNIDSYNRSTKQRMGRASIIRQSLARLHPILNRVYVIRTVFTANYGAYNILNGSFVDSEGYNAPYDNHDLNTYFAIDPSGKYLFNGSGVIRSSTEDKENDMKYITQLADPFNGMVFEDDGSKFYTVPTNENAVFIYDYSSLTKIGSIPLNINGKYLFKQGETFIIIGQASSSSIYCVQVIDLSALAQSVSLSVSPEQPQGVGTPITLSAEATGGVNLEYNFSVKEAGDDWKTLQSWSNVSTCIWAPKIGGTAILMVKARSGGSVGGIEVFTSKNYEVIPAGALPGTWKMPQDVTDAIIDPVNPIMYMTSKIEKKLYAVNYKTGDTIITAFQDMPESLEFGKGEYANELYVALLSRDHSPYWRNEDQSGKIAVINKENLQLIDTIDIGVDPFDLVAGRDGCLYVSSGSGQWTYFDSYNRSSKQRVGRVTIRQESYTRLHPILERIYTINTDTKWPDYHGYNISNGNFLDQGYASPYHEYYPLNTYFTMDPAGQYLFNGSGTIFATAVEKENDMKYVATLADSFIGLVFEDGPRFFTIPGGQTAIYAYNAGNRIRTDAIPLQGYGKFVFRKGDELITIVKTADSVKPYIIQDIKTLESDLTTAITSCSPQTAPGDKLEVTVQVANQNQVKNVTAFQIHYMLGDRELGSKRTSKLNCNKSITVKMKLSIPADVSYGTQILKVIVGQSSKENYVFNSVATSEVRIVHPDLVINSVTSKKAVIPGKANNIAANISNITVASAGEFKIKVYNGETATVLGEKSVVSLKKQKSKSVTIKVKLPTNFNSDTDYLRVVVDADQQITEEDENNNMCYYLKK
ncbi:MAG: CARDB domain-containing protein, partial [Chitinophagales bacterium]